MCGGQGLLPTRMSRAVVLERGITLLLGLPGQLLRTRHVAAELAAMFLLDHVHFLDGPLKIVRGGHRLVMKLVGERGIRHQSGAQNHGDRFEFHECSSSVLS